MATPRKKNPQKGGRPTSYKPRYAEQAVKLCELGAINEDLADAFKVSVATIKTWKKKYPKFLSAIKEAKANYDNQVEVALRDRAKGYTHPEEKVFCQNGKIVTYKTTKHYPPDTSAAFIWLKNRRPERWRDRQEVALSGDFSSFLKSLGGEDE